MPNLAADYTKEIRRQLVYEAAWPPNQRFALGTVGKLVDGIFQPLRLLEGASSLATVRSATPADPWIFVSEIGARHEANVKVKPNELLTGRGRVSLSRQGAIYFCSSGCKASRIEDQEELGRQLKLQFEIGAWDVANHVVVEVVEAQTCTVLIGGGGVTDVAVDVEGHLPVVAEGKSETHSDLRFESTLRGRCTPLFRTRALRWTLAGRKFLSAPNPDAQLTLAEYDELRAEFTPPG